MESEAFICFSIFTSEDWEGEAVLEDGKAKAYLITSLQDSSAQLRLPTSGGSKPSATLKAFIFTDLRKRLITGKSDATCFGSGEPATL